MKPTLTEEGKNLLLRSLTGETITFTKIVLGNGAAQDAATATGMISPLLETEITNITVGDDYVTLTALLSNGDVENAFHATEVGFFAANPDDPDKHILYALWNESESTSDYIPDRASRIYEMEISALVFVGEAENVAAAINSSLVYVSSAEFEAHRSDKNNPHGVTKAQVGLWNVPNVSTNDQTPTYSPSYALAQLTSGEKLYIAFAKLKTAVATLINHVANNKNPHGVTAAQTGAAHKKHTHAASDIADGVLSVARGGTGVRSLTALAQAMGVCKIIVGQYKGSGDINSGRGLSFDVPPKMVMIMPAEYISELPTHLLLIRGVDTTTAVNGQGSTIQIDWSETTVVWQSNASIYDQMDIGGRTYVYIAVI